MFQLLKKSIHKIQLCLQDSFRCIKNMGFFGKKYYLQNNHNHNRNHNLNSLTAFDVNSKLIILNMRFRFKVIVRYTEYFWPLLAIYYGYIYMLTYIF